MDNKYGKKQIPLTSGVQLRVLLGGIMAASLRTIIETPLEYAKVY